MFHFLLNIYHSILVWRNAIISNFTNDILDYKAIPIIINNRNRFTFLKLLIEALEKRKYTNIIILDNKSTYPPLLAYYKQTNHQVIYLNKNLGYNALALIPLYKKIRKNYFVYTDPDVVPIDECPDDFMLTFLQVLKKYPKAQKAGFSLKIDDLPDHFKDKQKVIDHESKFYTKRIDTTNFIAPIDTTFALHRPYAAISTRNVKMVRTGYPLSARHMPWYNDSSNLSDEEKYYINSVEIGTHWTKENY